MANESFSLYFYILHEKNLQTGYASSLMIPKTLIFVYKRSNYFQEQFFRPK